MGVADAGDAMTRVSRSLVYVLGALVVSLAMMGFECGPPGRDLPCTNQIVEGDVLHIELVAPYADVDGGVWAGPAPGGYEQLPSCVGIDRLAVNATFDAKIHGSREIMLCTQLGFVPQWDAPIWTGGAVPGNIVPVGSSSSEVAMSQGMVVAPAGCAGFYSISLFTGTGDIFAAPGSEAPFGTFVMRYFATNEPTSCGADFNSILDPSGAYRCGDMYLVRVTR